MNRATPADPAAPSASSHSRWWQVDPDKWRVQILTILMRGLVVLAPLVYVPSVMMALREEMPSVVLLDTVAVIGVIVLYLRKSLSFRIRAGALMVIFYALGAGLVVAVGSIGQVYLLGFAVMTTLLLGLRVGMAAAVLNGVTLLLVGVLAHVAPSVAVADWNGLTPWVVLTFNFLMVNALLALTLGAIIAALERAVIVASETRDELALERTGLLVNNQALADEVAERSRAEAQLKETSARLHGVLDHSPLLISLLDIEGRFILANRSVAAAMGREVSELEGSLIDDLVPPQEAAEFAARLAEVRTSRVPLTVRHELDVGHDHHTYSTVLFPLYGADGEVTSVGSIALDVSDQVRAQAEHERLEAQLVQAQKMEAVGRLAGGVAHDFNNMLGVIIGYTEFVSADPTIPESIRSDLEQVSAAARHSAELTRQLLAFARQQTITPEVLDLNVTVASMLKMLRRLIGEDIQLVWSPADTLWPVHMDPSQIDQVLANLMVNARDAIGAAGTITISTASVEIDEEYCAVHADFLPGEYALLSVADNGHGMDRATLERIFDPFFTTKPQGKGTGLGLSMVYGIVRQNNGFVHAYSEIGHGTTIRIYLPRQHGVVEDADAMRPRPTLPTGSETVLVVEDERALLALITRILERLHYVVLAAPTPGDALRIAAEHPGKIDILITDVILPEMNGLQLRERLLEIRPDMKSVFMSGYTSDIIGEHGVLDEGIHFLAKPFTPAEIADKVRTALTAS